MIDSLPSYVRPDVDLIPEKTKTTIHRQRYQQYFMLAISCSIKGKPANDFQYNIIISSEKTFDDRSYLKFLPKK